MLHILPFIFLAVALSAAGLLPGFLPFITLLLLWMLLLTRSAKTALTGARKSILWGTFLFLGLLLFSILPLPDAFVGPTRKRAFDRCRDFNESLALLSVDTLYQEGDSSLDLPFSRYLFRRMQRWINEDAFLAPHNDSEPFVPRQRRVRATLSLNRAGTVRTIFLAGGAFACFFLCVHSSHKQREKLLVFLIVLGGAVALAGIAGKLFLPQGKTVLWMFPVAHGKPIGPFVNRNHFAFFCAVLIPSALILCTRGIGTPAGRNNFGGKAASISVRLICLISLLLMALGVVVSLSRSGLLVMISSLLILIALTLRKPSLWAGVLALLAAGMIAGLWVLPMEEFQARKETLQDPLQTGSAKTRFQVWGDAMTVWRQFPVFGAGADAFRTVYPTCKNSTARKGAIHAENEYVQVLADNGILGAGVLVMTLMFYTVCIGKRTDNETPAAGTFRMIAWVTLAAMAVHAFFDFGLRIPLNALLVACLLGCAMPEQAPGEPPAANGTKPPAFAAFKHPFFFCVTSLLVVLIPLAERYWLAGWEMDEYTALEKASLPTLTKAVAWAPLYWHPWYESGRRCIGLSRELVDSQDPRAPIFMEMGKGCIWLAGYLNPTDYRVWREAARVAFELGNLEEADQAARKVIELRPYLKNDVKPYLLNLNLPE